MPFFKTHEPTNQFFKFFLDKTTKKVVPIDNREHPMLPIALHTGGDKDFMVRYYRRSGRSSIEDLKEYYPCIVIQDFQPVLDKSMIWGRSWIEGAIAHNQGQREKIYLPIPVKYQFQVSVVTRRHKEIQSANDWFFQNFDFQHPGFFEFNKLQTVEGVVADIIPYMATWGEVPRDDGRFEYAFDFMLDVPIHAKQTEYVYDPLLVNPDTSVGGFVGGNFEDAIQNLKIKLNAKSRDGLVTFLQHQLDLSV